MNKDTILLVEDDADEAELALRGFARIAPRLDIHWARNGEEALDFLFRRGQHQERCHGRNPRLIMLDIALPGINGFDVVKAVRSHPDYRHTPIVILTTSDERSDILQCYSLGANSYLCKPVDFESFADILQQVSRYWLRTNISSH